MLWTLRKLPAAALALGLVAGAGMIGGPAQAAALPKPRSEQWWFTAWDIQNQVWQQSRGSGFTVAVIDTGVNAKIPELRGAVLPGSDGRHGYTTDGRTDTDKKDGHGTEMAALIASRGGPSGVVGVAPEAKILPIVTDGFSPSTAKAIQFAADHGAKVINVSEGTPYPGGCPGDVQAAVSYAVDKGSVVVASMGNEGNTTNSVLFPASCGGVLGVGAINNRKLAWTRTQRQPYVSVAAPGVEVGSVTKKDTFLNTISGTSQASALASGALALVWSKSPQLTPREIVQRIINTAVDAGPAGHDNMTGSGVIVPIRALTTEVPKNAPNPTFDRLDQWRAENPGLVKQPSGAATASSSSAATAKKKSDSNSGLVAAIIGVAILAVIAAVVVLLLLRRRKAGARPVVHEQPFPGGPGQFPPGAGPYGRPQGQGNDGRSDRPGPPPSFGPPQGPGSTQG